MYILNSIKKRLFIVLLVGLIVSVGFMFNAFAEDPGIVLPSNGPELRGGWYTLDPYLYQTEENGIKTLHGLDYELMKVISKDVGERVIFEHMDWKEQLQELEEGKRDFATGATYTKDRADFMLYSVPYRFEENALFVPIDAQKNIHFKTIIEMLEYIKQNNFKLGIVNGYVYADSIINDFINDPANQRFILKSNNDYESLEYLLDNEIDGFLADRIVGSTVIWRMHAGKRVSEIPLNAKKPVHMIFSKKTVSPELVEKYNQSINKLKNTEKFQKIVSWYLYPILFLQTEDTNWFKFTEILGTIAFAISGLIIAYKEKTTLFGALILAILPSLGGGLMRDVIFGRNPVGALQSPIYLACVILTVFTGFVAIKLLTYCRKWYTVPGEIEHVIRKDASVILVITDAIGLAMFSVTGVIVSLSAKADPLWIWGPFFAFLTGAGGGILRDMLSKTRYISALEGELYGEIAIFWGFLLSVFILMSAKNAQPEYIQYGVIVAILGVFFTRIIVHFMHVPNARFAVEDE